MKDILIKILPYMAIGITVISIIVVSVKNKKRLDIANKLASFLYYGKFKEFDEFIESEQAKKLAPFNIEFMKLNRYIFDKKDNKITECLTNLENMKLSNKEKEAVYTKGFYHYLNKKENEKTTHYYQLLEKLNRSNFKDVDRLYNTYIQNKADYLDITLSQLETSDDSQKPQLELLISNMYANLNDKENVEKYAKLAQEHLNHINENISK